MKKLLLILPLFFLMCEEKKEYECVEHKIKSKKESIETHTILDYGKVVPITETCYYFFYEDGGYDKVNIQKYQQFSEGENIIVTEEK